MRKVFLLVNALEEFTFGALVREVLPGVRVTVGEDFPAHPEDHDLVVLWSIRRLVPRAAGCRNAIVFHSSDLPRGRGWAPVYHAIASGLELYTITGASTSMPRKPPPPPKKGPRKPLTRGVGVRSCLY
jgi:hypothetical protein